MAKGKGRKKAARHRAQPETSPARNRLQQAVASCGAPPGNVMMNRHEPSPTTMIDGNTAQMFFAETTGSWVADRAVGDSLPASPTTAGSRPKYKASLSDKESERVAGSANINSATVDHEDSFQHINAPRNTSLQLTSSNASPASLSAEDLDSRIPLKRTTNADEKRDSVISVAWEEAEVGEDPQDFPKRASNFSRWRRGFRAFPWWPCRVYRWFRTLIFAVFRGFQSSRRLDFILTSALLLACVYIAYSAMDFIFTGLIKPVSAQALVEAANCSVVYVTIPGPIITVSLIAASPTDPARGTYYYSVINGTTQWLNSIAPPSRSSALVTLTSSPSPGILSSQTSMLAPAIPPSTLYPAPSLPNPSGTSIALTTTITSGDVVMVSTTTLLPSIISITTTFLSSSMPLPGASTGSSTPSLKTSGPNLNPDVSSPTLSPTVALSSAILVSSSRAIPTLSTSGAPQVSTGSVGHSGPASSFYSAIVPSSPEETSVGGFVTISSFVGVITSFIPGGSATVFTSIFVTSISASLSVSSSMLVLPPTSSSSVASTMTPTVGSSNLAPDPALPPGAATSTSAPAVSASLSSAFPTTVTSLQSDGQTFTMTLVSTSSPNSIITTHSTIVASSMSLITISTPLPGEVLTSSVAITTAFTSGVTLTQVSSSSSVASGASSPTAASPTNTMSSGEFTVSLPDPAIGSSGSDLAPTTTRLQSGLTTTLTGFVSIATTVRSTIASSPLTSMASTSVTDHSSVLLSIPSSSTLAVSSTSSIVASRSGSLESISSGRTEILTTPPSSSPGESSSSRSTSTLSSASLTAIISSEPFPSSIASSPILSSKTSSLTVAVSSLTSFQSPDSASTTSPVLPSFETSSVSTSLSSETSSSLPIAQPPATITTNLGGSDTLTASHSTSSSSSFTSASETAPLSLTTTLAALNTSTRSSSMLSSRFFVSLTSSTSSSLSFLQSSSLPSSGIAGSMPLSSLSLETTSSPALLPGAPSTVFVNTTSTNMSSTASSTWFGASTSLGVSLSVSSSWTSSTLVASSAVSVLPTGPRSNSSSSSLSSSSSTTLITSVVTTSTPLNTTSALQLRALMTKIVSYGDASVVFVFPTPIIETTQSYWTGTYPTVTGPEPSELQTMSLATRSIRQTPLSQLPWLELFTTARGSAIVTNTGAHVAAVPTETDQVARAEPTKCGESGNFTLSFDDTSVGSDGHDVVVVQGMKNPYHHLFYANGYTYVPDKWEPYPAMSQPNVAMYLPLTGRLLPNTPFAGTLLPGEIGAGPRASVTAYWFNAHSGYFGCALSGLTPCTLRISGYRYDALVQEEVLVAEQNATLPACYGYVDCQLTQVVFNDEFRALSGIQFNAFTYKLGIPQVHVMDDLQLEWYNDTCSAGIWRIGHL